MRIKIKYKILINIFIILIGISFIIINYYQDYQKNIKEKYIFDNCFKNYSEINSFNIENEYIMFIEIPKINFYKGIYSQSNSQNNIKYNIEILLKSNLPDKINGNVILAAHSGNGKVAYFNDIIYLNIDDLINIYYNNEKYTYKVTNIYEIDKTGLANIKRDKNTSNLTLITCNKKDKTKQIIIIADRT